MITCCLELSAAHCWLDRRVSSMSCEAQEGGQSKVFSIPSPWGLFYNSCFKNVLMIMMETNHLRTRDMKG